MIPYFNINDEGISFPFLNFEKNSFKCLHKIELLKSMVIELSLILFMHGENK